MKSCSYCGGVGVEKEDKQELGHGYWGVEFYVECMNCEATTEKTEWLDIDPVGNWEVLKHQVLNNWNLGHTTRSKKASNNYYIKLGKIYESIMNK